MQKLVLKYLLIQMMILCLLPFVVIANKICNGRLTNTIRYFAAKGGPFFIKFFQWITQKEELSYLLCINSIKDLQHFCNLKNQKHAEKIIKKNNLNVYDLEYLGAGSIAQVYKCKYNNKQCAIKILHEDIAEIITANIYIARTFFYISQKYNIIPLFKSYDFEKIFSEHLRQCDLMAEGKNTMLLHNNNKINNVHYAEIYYLQQNIIIEEYFNGYKYDNFIKIYPDYAVLSKCMEMTAFLNMIFCMNIIHGDCHDGNILYNVINGEIHIYLIDCGILHNIDDEFKEVLYKMFIGYNTKNTDLQISLYEKYNIINNDDKEELKFLLLNAMNENRKKNNFGLYIKRILDINRKYKLCGHYLFDILCVNILLILGDRNDILAETIKYIMKEKKYDDLYKELNKYYFDLF